MPRRIDRWRRNGLLFPPILVSLFVLLAPTAFAGEGNADDLVAEARERDLASRAEWRDLLHFRDRRFLPGQRSATRDPNFFNAEMGWQDAEAELAATLRAFFRDSEQVADDEQHPQCRFPARRAWLLEQLGRAADALPSVTCSRYREWLQGIRPGQVTLVFADAYLGNPSSMYGHTLLRIDPPQDSGDSRLLSYAINHAAATNESNGLLFAIRGLTGGYAGRFNIMPYYEKVRQYNSSESRDLWEYRLNLAPDEVDRLMQHAWELRGTDFPYYFFYQNCSYRLLGLLDVARPGLDLADAFSWWAIPTDTVRETLAREGVLDEVVYRPAERTRLDHQLSLMGREAMDATQAVASGQREPGATEGLTAAEHARVLESAHDYLHYEHQRDPLDQAGRERMREILVARSELADQPRTEDPDAPSVRPDQGHGTLRLGAGGGARDDQAFASVHWRPAYHDALDPPGGYLEGAHIDYADLELRIWDDNRGLELERFMAIDIESLHPRNQLFRPWSWRVRAGAEQRPRPGGGRALMTGVDGGGGAVWQLGDERLWGYAGAQASIWASDRLRERVRGIAGPQLDLLWQGRRLRARVSARSGWSTDADEPPWHLGAEGSVAFGRSLSLRAGVSREQDFGVHQTAVRMTLYGYF
ncbi:MAG: DUF4105 domain-containing protein [Ectothiorhodospiraceae bacterium]